MAGKFDGTYLVTNSEPIFSDSPEIFILRQNGEEITAYCVNQVADIKPIDVFKKRYSFDQPIFKEAMNDSRLNKIPIFTSSKTANLDDVHVLVCDHFSGKKYSAQYDQFYSVQTMEEFLPSYFENDPYPFVFVTKPAHVDVFALVVNLMMESWSTYDGLYGMTYGLRAENKLQALEILKPHEKLGSPKWGEKFWGALSGFSWITNEITPSMNRAKSYAYFRRHYPDMNEEDELQAFRMSLAVSETEMKDFAKVMHKYSFEEIEQRYAKAIKKGFKINFLNRFDAQSKFFEMIDLHPLLYHLSVTKIFARINNKSKFKKNPPRSEATRKTERLFAMMKSIIGGR